MKHTSSLAHIVLLLWLLAGAQPASAGDAAALPETNPLTGKPYSERARAEYEAQLREWEEQNKRADAVSDAANEEFAEARARNKPIADAYEQRLEDYGASKGVVGGVRRVYRTFYTDDGLPERGLVQWTNGRGLTVYSAEFDAAGNLVSEGQTADGRAWETIEAAIQDGDSISYRFAAVPGGGYRVSGVTIRDGDGYERALLEFNEDGYVWRGVYYDDEGNETRRIDKSELAPKPDTMGGPLPVPDEARPMTGICQPCLELAYARNDLAGQLTAVVKRLQQVSLDHTTAFRDQQYWLKQQYAELMKQYDALRPQFDAAHVRLLECLKTCERTAAIPPDPAILVASGGMPAADPEDPNLTVERAQVVEMRVPPEQDPAVVTGALPDATAFPIPAGAGGGTQVAVAVPSDDAAAASLQAKLDTWLQDGLIVDLQTTPCRKFLPDATAPQGGGTTPVVRTARTAQIVKGTARTQSGLELGHAIVVLVPTPAVAGPPEPEESDADEETDGEAVPWIPGVDDRPPAIGVPDPNGDFVIVVPDGYAGPYRLVLAPVCNCTTTSQPHTSGTQTVPVTGETMTTPPPEQPMSSVPNEPREPEPCYCGPDITAALTAAINRAQQRIDALPSNEVGVYDGVEFLANNADAFDAPVAPIKDPTIDPATMEDAKSDWLCPSGICAEMEQTPFTLAGYCLPKHVSNEILAAFVASGVGVPIGVFSLGANVREIVNNGGIEGDTPMVAYMTGYQLQSKLSDLGSLGQSQVEKIVSDVLETSLFGYFQNYAAIKDEYPTLAHCEACPYDVEGHFTKDFTEKPWKLHDGTRVGGDADSKGDATEADLQEGPQTKPKLKADAKPPKDCDTAGA